MNHDDEEIKRQLYTEQIQWWIQQSEEDISALKGCRAICLANLQLIIDILDEIKLIQFSKEPIPSVNPLPQPTNVLPVNQPFTLVTTKDRMYKEAIGKGYPR